MAVLPQNLCYMSFEKKGSRFPQYIDLATIRELNAFSDMLGVNRYKGT